MSGRAGYVEMAMKSENQNYLFPYLGGIIFNIIFTILFLYFSFGINSDLLLMLYISIACSNLCYAIINCLTWDMKTMVLDGFQIKECNILKKKGDLNHVIAYYNTFDKLVNKSLIELNDDEILIDSNRDIYMIITK